MFHFVHFLTVRELPFLLRYIQRLLERLCPWWTLELNCGQNLVLSVSPSANVHCCSSEQNFDRLNHQMALRFQALGPAHKNGDFVKTHHSACQRYDLLGRMLWLQTNCALRRPESRLFVRYFDLQLEVLRGRLKCAIKYLDEIPSAASCFTLFESWIHALRTEQTSVANNSIVSTKHACWSTSIRVWI